MMQEEGQQQRQHRQLQQRQREQSPSSPSSSSSPPPPSPPPLISEHDNHAKNEQQQTQQLQQERPITIELIRKRSEHNSNLISNLEEIALHQEELTSIGTTIGKVCGKTLRILLLQNNVISHLLVNELKYFKVLEYLNLALNNITVVRGFNGFSCSACNHESGNGSVDAPVNSSSSSSSSSTNTSTSANIYNYNEHLSKIDLTLNFIDYDTLEESMDCLSTLRNLKELFMMGNPCCISIDNDNDCNKEKGASSPCDSSANTHTTTNTEWKNFRMYVISKLSLLERLDGREILRSERIRAMQMRSKLKEELDVLANRCKVRKEEQKWKSSKELKQQLESKHCISSSSNSEIVREGEKNDCKDKDEDKDEERTKHCPEDRVKLSNEMYMQKQEKERNERANQPKLKGEKEFEEDQLKAIEKAREREEKGHIKQCNEGKWDFTFDEEKKPGYLTLDISIQRHLSSSLIDVDVHPTYISVIIKSKVLRLALPIEVKAGDSTATRSLTTGHLLITMPKFNPKDQAFIVNTATKGRRPQSSGVVNEGLKGREIDAQDGNGVRRIIRKNQSMSIQQELLRDAQRTLTGPVQLKNIVRERHEEKEVSEKSTVALDFVELSTRIKKTVRKDETSIVVGKMDDEEEGPPPMF